MKLDEYMAHLAADPEFVNGMLLIVKGLEQSKIDWDKVEQVDLTGDGRIDKRRLAKAK